MYLFATSTLPNLKVEARTKPPFGLGFDAETVERATRMESWATQITDPGPDRMEFRLFKGDDLIDVKTVNGYGY